MVKRMISIVLAVVMTLSLTIVPASAADTASDASTNLVYYDLQDSKWSVKQWLHTSGSTFGPATDTANAGGFISAGKWTYVNVKNSGSVKTLTFMTNAYKAWGSPERVGILIDDALAEGDYTTPFRKASLSFQYQAKSNGDTLYDKPLTVWFNLYTISAKGLKEIALSANAMSDSLSNALNSCADDDMILFLWDIKHSWAGRNSSNWTGTNIYPICVLGKLGKDTSSGINYLYQIDDAHNLNVLQIVVDNVIKDTLLDGTTALSDIPTFVDKCCNSGTGSDKAYCAGNLEPGAITKSDTGFNRNVVVPIAIPKDVVANNSGSSYPHLFVTFDELKYEGVKFIETNVGKDETAVPVHGNDFIKIQFNEILESPENIIWEDFITLTDASDSTVIWTGVYDENENAYKISIDPSNRLEHSTQYYLKLQGNISFEEFGALSINEVKNFTTTYKKLNVKSSLSSVPTGGEFSVPLEVENVSLDGGEFIIAAALYKKDAATVNMIECKSVTKNVALGDSDDTISVGPFNAPSAEGAEYFVKVFFTENTLEGDKPIAQPIVLGAVKAPEGEIPAGSPTDSLNQDDFALEFTKVYDIGRIKFEGTYSKTVKRPVFVMVKDRQSTPNVVYIDQLTVADDGKLGMDFNLIPELPIYSNGAYILDVTLNPTVGSVVTKEISMDFSNIKPVVSNLKFADVVPYCDGRSLPAEYDYFHFGGADSASTVNWYEYNEAYGYDTANSVLLQAGSPSLALTADLKGKEIYFTVLARTSGNPALEADAPVVCENKIKLTLGPVASNVGIIQEGNTLKPTYVYTHGLGYEEQGTVYTWYRANSADGEYTKVGTEANYSVTMSDKDKYFKVEVIPKARLDAEENEEETEINVERVGESVWSTQPYQAKYVLPVEDSGSDDSSPSSSPGGGGGRAPKENKVEITPVDTSGTVDLTDIKGHWAENDIYNLYDKGIIKGRTEHTFDPEGKITRAEFVALIVRALNLGEATSTSFSDVSAADWYAGVLGAAYEKGILSGSEGNAYPNRQITRQEMAAIAVRALELNGESIALSGDILDFDDAATIDLWAIEAVAKAKTAGLIKGDGSNYRPLDNTSRAEAAVIVSRLLAMR